MTDESVVRDLVAALRPFLSWHSVDHSGSDPSGRCSVCAMVGAAKRAIAKAEGK